MTDICKLKADQGNFAMDTISNGEALSDNALSNVTGGILGEIILAVVTNWVTNGSGNGKAWNENFKGCIGI